MNQVKKNAEQHMQKSIEALHNDLSKLRTGRAHPSLLDQVKVPYYGNDTPLNQVANVSVLDSRTLQVTPWEKHMVSVVEKAIMQADLGLNPSTQGQAICVPLPALTEERRKDLIKLVKQEAEKARVGIRNTRRDANDALKALLKNKEISEDDERRMEAEIQKVTDKFTAEVEAIIVTKEKELMVV